VIEKHNYSIKQPDCATTIKTTPISRWVL